MFLPYLNLLLELLYQEERFSSSLQVSSAGIRIQLIQGYQAKIKELFKKHIHIGETLQNQLANGQNPHLKYYC